MKVFIVHAHPEPRSFNAALTREAVKVLTAEGHEVVVSDLYAQEWNPVSDRRNFTTVANPEYLKLQDEERHASANHSFAPDVQAELDKALSCDALIFQFPMFWFSMPAILKGWVDRTFAAGETYGRGRWFDNGVFKGKRAMLSITTGGPESLFTEDGLNGDIHQLLYPINHGTFRFVGFDVLRPFVAWSAAAAGDEGRAKYLEEYGQRLRTLWTETPVSYPSLSEFDPSTFRRRS